MTISTKRAELLRSGITLGTKDFAAVSRYGKTNLRVFNATVLYRKRTLPPLTYKAYFRSMNSLRGTVRPFNFNRPDHSLLIDLPS